MIPEEIKKILQEVKNGSSSVESAMDQLRDLPFEDIGFAKIDHHRELRTGYPEVILCSGKTIAQITKIIAIMYEKGNNILATRANPEIFNAITDQFPEAIYNETAKAIVIKRKNIESSINAASVHPFISTA